MDIVLASLKLLLMLVLFCGSCFAFKAETDLYDALAHNPSTLPIWNPKSLNMWNLLLMIIRETSLYYLHQYQDIDINELNLASFTM